MEAPPFASSTSPLPDGWYRIIQKCHYSTRAIPIDPLFVSFTTPGWPRNGGVPMNMGTQVENGDDKPLEGFREPCNLTFKYLGDGHDSIPDSKLHNASSLTRRELFIAASNVLTRWVVVARSLSITRPETQHLKFVYENGATLAISSIYFPTTANIAQIEVIVIPPQIF